jgi:succinate dehydrogenase/fumarate reductase flavoprotein subunit
MMENKYDVFVIGSGPGGEGAAMTCAKQNKKVAVCDEFSLRSEATRTGEQFQAKLYDTQVRYLLIAIVLTEQLFKLCWQRLKM